MCHLRQVFGAGRGHESVRLIYFDWLDRMRRRRYQVVAAQCLALFQRHLSAPEISTDYQRPFTFTIRKDEVFYRLLR
jgi:hypothetical protein